VAQSDCRSKNRAMIDQMARPNQALLLTALGLGRRRVRSPHSLLVRRSRTPIR
jgi:hypothetical protein